MLVVVHYGNVQFCLQATLYLEALGCLDILQVDTAKGGGDGLNRLDELLGVLLVHLYVEHVNAAINLEEQALALHYGLAADCTYVAKAQYGGTVAYHRHKVALAGVLVGIVGILLNLQTRLCHTWRVCQGKVGLCTVRFCGNYLYLARLALGMISQGSLFCNLCHKSFTLIF